MQYHEDVLKLAMGSGQRVTRSYSVHGTDPVNSDSTTIAQIERREITVQFGDLLTISKHQLYNHHPVTGGADPKYEVGLEHHFEGILRTLPTKKRHLGDVQRPILQLRWGIVVWSPVPIRKVAAKKGW